MFCYENAQTASKTCDKPKQRIYSRRNNTGLPDRLKEGIENLSGYSMDNVRVHYNSSKPAQLNAYAYTQGTEIYVAPGQENHLPHEAWHVVQQMQGRVKPMYKMHGVNINDDPSLENAASTLGAKANGFSGATQLKKKEIKQPCIQCEFNSKQLNKVLKDEACGKMMQNIANRPSNPQQNLEDIRRLINTVYPNKGRASDSNIKQVARELKIPLPEESNQDLFSYDESRFTPIFDGCPKTQLVKIYNEFESEKFIKPYTIHHIEHRVDNSIGKIFWTYVPKDRSQGNNQIQNNKDDYLIDILGVYVHEGSQKHQNKYKKCTKGGSGGETIIL